MGDNRKKMPGNSSCRRKLVLKPEQAAAIYALKPVFDVLTRGASFDIACKVKGRSVPVGKMFNVSAKTIRDIWSRRTWSFATCHLWKGERKYCQGSAHRQVTIQPQLNSTTGAQFDSTPVRLAHLSALSLNTFPTRTF
jgi:hypothetical protein